MSYNFLIWNARGVANPSTQRAFNSLIKAHNISFAAIIEPMVVPRSEVLKTFILDFKMENSNNQIWILANGSWAVEKQVDREQVLHVKIRNPAIKNPLFLSIIYGKSRRRERKDLWQDLRGIAEEVEGNPWLVGGDFNIFAAENEKQGGEGCSRGKRKEMMDFVEMMSDCQLLDPGSDGAQFSWARGETFEKIDRVLLAEGWSSVFESTRITILPRTVSDHGPLLIRCKEGNKFGHATFRFQNMWVRHHEFLSTIKAIWEEETGARGVRNLQFKLDRVKKGLKRWNKEKFGNLFERLHDAEKKAAEAQQNFEMNPTPESRSENHKAVAELILTQKMEEDFWRQKASIRWTAEGERNTKFFQGWVRQKRVKGKIHGILDGNVRIEDEKEVRESAVRFFQNLLTSEGESVEEPNLDILSELSQSFDRNDFSRTPSSSEVKQAVFNISVDSASGPDGFSAAFFQSCWDLVEEDVTAAVGDFFNGAYLPRSFTATMIVLLPKKDKPESWTDFRPISLCNVTNKIISKIVAARIGQIMPEVIAPNQSGFLQGRLLCDNVLLAQELVHDLAKCNPTPNVVIKLDMAKAYDRVHWNFILKVHKKMGFDDKGLSIIERCINSNWFSVLINGAPGGFFKSSRGLRQGDPLSPALFVLAADYLSRSLDQLILNRDDIRFKTARQCPGVSHLAYADDVVIFAKASRQGMEDIVECLEHYSAVSGQKINMGKSQFFIDGKHHLWADEIAESSGFQRGMLPFTYLGVPIYRGIKRTAMFLTIREMISKRIHSWSHKFLSFGGRLALIKSTLSAIPLHVFQVIEPTAHAIKFFESILSRFFWGSNNVVKRTHWISWDQICHPIDEGGLGVRKFGDMVEAFGMKLWWRFRAQGSLWANFLLKKYCHRESVQNVKGRTGSSPTWRRMIRARDRMQQHIQWSVGEGNLDFWDDVWLGDRPIRDLGNPGVRFPRRQVCDFWNNGAWDVRKLMSELLPLGVLEDDIKRIGEIPIDETGQDSMRWALTPHGNFSTTSAWELVRHRQQKVDIFKLVWNEGILPSISIFVWRLLANRIPVDEKLQWRNIQLASKCRCCKSPQSESREHLFIQGPGTKRIWRYFEDWFPTIPRLGSEVTNVETRVKFWHQSIANVSSNHMAIIIPCLIVWNIWAERNNVIHRGSVFNPETIIEKVMAYIQAAISAKKVKAEQWKGCIPSSRLSFPARSRIETFRQTIVRWNPPPCNWIKMNLAGVIEGRDTTAGLGGVSRDDKGNIIFGFAIQVQARSEWEAGVKAVLAGINEIQNPSRPVWFELESKELVELIDRGKRGRSEHRHLITSLRNGLRRVKFKVSFTPREGNKIANFLAGKGRSGESSRFDDRTAPNFVKALAKIDQSGRPNFRQGEDFQPP